MTPQDHNKTLVIIFSSFSALWTLVLLASPWIVAQTFRHQEQIPAAVLLFGFVFLMALLFWSTAIAMHRRKPLGRKFGPDFSSSVADVLASHGLYLVVRA